MDLPGIDAEHAVQGGQDTRLSYFLRHSHRDVLSCNLVDIVSFYFTLEVERGEGESGYGGGHPVHQIHFVSADFGRPCSIPGRRGRGETRNIRLRYCVKHCFIP